GHVFTVQAAGLHEYQSATRSKDVARSTPNRANLPFPLGSELPQAIKIVGRLYHARTLEARIRRSAPSLVGAILTVYDGVSLSSAFCIGNPSAGLADMVLLVTCQVMAPQKPWSGLVFQGGFDPREQFDDVNQSANFLALSYPIENFAEL